MFTMRLVPGGTDGEGSGRARLRDLVRRHAQQGQTATHVLVIVQNLPVPLDRRVWLECLSLRANGYDVSVICPKGPGDPARQEIDGIRIYKYRPAPQADGLLGYVLEFVYSWLRTALLSRKVWRRRPFEVMQACNPPDTYWLLARLWRRRGVKFVFDQHDLNPELFLSRFGQPTSLSGRLQLRGLTWLEKQTYDVADHVVTTNESYKRIAMSRGGLPAEMVTVVRSGPDTSEMRPIYPSGDVVAGQQRPFELAYLGIMGPQDGVSTILEVMDQLVTVRGRDDVHATLMGFGDCLEDLRVECTERGLDDVVTFTGRADKVKIAQVLSAADIGLCPDHKTPLNDVSTMNKTMEYMAYALPSVAFDLVETRVSGGDSVSYVESGDVLGFTDAVEALLDDPERRIEMALKARARVSAELDWAPQSASYVGVFHALTGNEDDVVAWRAGRWGGQRSALRYVDLSDQRELRRFILERSAPELETGKVRRLQAV
jgi:glycosyltransferase involved in cell wall biosynthesis